MKFRTLLACLAALTQLAQASPQQPEPETVGDLHALLAQGIEHPALYNHFYKDIVRVKFPDTCCVRLRGGQPKDAAAPKSRPVPTEKIAGDISLAEALAELARRGAKWEHSCSLPEADVDALVARAYHHTPGEIHPDLNNYLCLHLPETLTSGSVINLLRGVPCIEAALLLPKVAKTLSPDTLDVACIPDYTDSSLTIREGYQGYLDPAPGGVDARFAWEGFLGDATGITVADMEFDFLPTHVDLPEVDVFGVDTPASEAQINHGTSVLGIIGGIDNGFGIKGIAYGADLAFSRLVNANGNQDPAAAITRAANRLDPGDVILIEIATPGPRTPTDTPPDGAVGFVPVSYNRGVYDAIRVAVAAGITVCEGGGNSGEDLDDGIYVAPPGFTVGRGPFFPTGDTGSIIVGAGDAPVSGTLIDGDPITPRARTPFSSFGSTIDLQAWGFLVSAPGEESNYDAPGKNLDYQETFAGTSSATAIIAGCCAVIQRAFQLKNGRHATSREVRDILRATGTPQDMSRPGNIGPLPNLRAAIESLASPGIVGAAPPTVEPPAGNFTDALVSVTLGYSADNQTATNTRIHYTLNGTDPTLDSFRYIPDPQERIVIASSATLSARIFRFDPDLKRWFGSETVAGVYNVGALPRTATPLVYKEASDLDPRIVIQASCYQAPIRIGFISPTPGSFYRYRLDGDRDLLFDQDAGFYIENSQPFSIPIGSHQLIVVAYGPGLSKSEVSPTYSFQVAANCNLPLSNGTPLPAPRIFPDGGTFPDSASVSLTSPTPVYYTIDGSEPTISSPVYRFEPIILNASATIKAKSFLNNFTPSQTASAEFVVIGKNSLAAPTVTPQSGNYTSSVTLTMNSADPRATLHYTTNGAIPTAFSPVYTAPINLGIGFHTVRARTYFENVSPSPITTKTYTVHDPATLVQAPVMSPRGGSHTGATNVELTTTTAGATIYYTIDELGSVTQSDRRYTPGTPIVLQPSTSPQIIRASAFKPGSTPSAQDQNSFRIFTPVGNCEFVLFDPPAGTYDNTVRVTLSSTTSSVTFKTTDDGSHPNTSETASTRNRSTGAFISPTLSQPFTISRSGVYQATAQRLSFTNSGVTAQEYRLVCGTPTPDVAPGTYASSVEIALSSSTSSSATYYTTDGSLPTSASTRYTSPFTIGEGITTVNAITLKSGFEDSELASLAYAVLPANPDDSAPQITTALSDVTVESGVQVVLLTGASGFPTPNLSWEFDRNTLPFSGNELILPVVQAGNSGTYTMTATNAIGSASTSARLTVRPTSDVARPQISSITRSTSSDAFDIRFPTTSGKQYQIETSTTGTIGSWSPSGDAVSGNGSDATVSVPAPSGEPVLLIRIRES